VATRDNINVISRTDLGIGNSKNKIIPDHAVMDIKVTFKILI
jgi:hypothetical protein